MAKKNMKRKTTPKANPKSVQEYVHVVCMSKGGYQHKDSGYNLPYREIVKVKKEDLEWLKNVRGVTQVQVGPNITV